MIDPPAMKIFPQSFLDRFPLLQPAEGVIDLVIPALVDRLPFLFVQTEGDVAPDSLRDMPLFLDVKRRVLQPDAVPHRDQIVAQEPIRLLLQPLLECQAAQNLISQPPGLPDIQPRAHAPVPDQTDVPDLILFKLPQDVRQRPGVEDVPLVNLMEDRQSLLLGHGQSDLDLGVLASFGVVPPFGQRTAQAVEVDIGQVIEVPRGRDVQDRFQPPEDAALDSGQVVDRVDRPQKLLVGDVGDVQEVRDLGLLVPLGQAANAVGGDAVGVRQAEQVFSRVSQEGGEIELPGDLVQDEQWAVDGDFIDRGALDGPGQEGFVVDLLADIADMFLDDLAVDPGVLDLSQVDRISPFYFSDEAHGVYYAHHDMKCQETPFPHPVDIPGTYITPDSSV